MAPRHPEIQHAVDAVRVIDTHEHLIEESERLAMPLDFVTLFQQYAESDLRTAGMPEADWVACIDPATPISRKWALFDPWYQRARNTAYCRASQIAIRDLYGIEELSADTVELLSQRLAERNKPGVMEWILQERCGIEYAQVNALFAPFTRPGTDPSLFRVDISAAPLLRWPVQIEDLERMSGVSADSFAGYARAIDTIFERYAPAADAMKQQSAYWRVQRFEDVSDASAERIFNQMCRDPYFVSEDDRKRLQDWNLHRCIRNCIDHHLLIKSHTGYKAGQDWMQVEHVKPTDLTNLFMQYPQAKFSLFHVGYPYQDEVLALTKHFTNVYADLCWTWIIDPEASRQFLKQAIAAVPANKVLGFGGDFIQPEPIYGHLRIARDQITHALTEIVADDYFTVDEAKHYAQRLLRDNALDLTPPGNPFRRCVIS